MNIFQKIALARKLNADANQITEGLKMKNSTKIIAGIVAALTAVIQVPEVQHAIAGAIAAHPSISSLAAGISAILALVHNPKGNQ